MIPKIVLGNLLNQDVDVIVNAWNRNFIPWWLLVPQGISGSIKKHGGIAPFQEVSRAGLIRVGEAVLTTAGRLPFKGIIHVAGLNCFWRASTYSIQQSVNSAMTLAERHGFQSIAFPTIGAGTGGVSEELSLAHMQHALALITSQVNTRIVVFDKSKVISRHPA